MRYGDFQKVASGTNEHWRWEYRCWGSQWYITKCPSWSSTDTASRQTHSKFSLLRRVGQKAHRRGKRRAPRERGGAPRPSPRSAQVPIHHPGHVHVQPALADSGYPARPGRLGGRLRGGGVQRARLQLHRQGQAVRALRPPSSANMYRFHASGAKATVTRRSTTPNETASQTPPDSVWVFGAWKMNVLVDHFTHYVKILTSTTNNGVMLR